MSSTLTSSASSVQSSSLTSSSIASNPGTVVSDVSGLEQPRRSFFRSFRLSQKRKHIPTNTEQPEQEVQQKQLKIKVDFTMQSLLDFQHTCKVHSELAPDTQKQANSILEHHRRPNYNSTQRKLKAKGRKHCEHLASKKVSVREALPAPVGCTSNT